jgi:hypothetical protein
VIPVESLLVIVNAVAMPATAVLVPAPVATVERVCALLCSETQCVTCTPQQRELAKVASHSLYSFSSSFTRHRQ